MNGAKGSFQIIEPNPAYVLSPGEHPRSFEACLAKFGGIVDAEGYEWARSRPAEQIESADTARRDQAEK